MESTVLIGDHLLVDKLSYAPADAITRHLLPYTEPKRGDVIVFRYPMDIRQNFVKRVIGVPGDHIHIVDKVVYVNGKALTELYTQHIDPRVEPYRDNFPSQPYGPVTDRAQEMLASHVQNGELVVPAENYFAMGDNRENSLDSRYWGFVPRENIIGKPLVIFWSYDAPTEEWAGDSGSHYVDLAKNFFTKTRWNRTLKLVRGIPIE
jgi:signal peptidase I